MTSVIVIASSLLLAAAVGATFLMARASAASRHAVWTAALFAVIAMPAARLLLPAIEVPVLISSVAVAVPPGTADPQSAGGRANGAPLALGAFATNAETASINLVATIWFAGVIALLLWYGIGTIGVWRLRRGSLPGPDRVQERAASQALAAGVARTVRVRLAADERVPMTWGLLRPTILLPAGAADWPDERLDAVLAHELAHAARLDVLAHRIARAAAALYWFNPLVWFALRQAQLERERACDDLVLAGGSLASSYAGELLAFARSLSAPAAVLPMARRSRLEARVMAILDPRTNRKGTSALVATLTVMIVGVAVAASVITVSAYDLPSVRPLQYQLHYQQSVPPQPPPPPPQAERRIPPPPPPPPPADGQGKVTTCEEQRARAVAVGFDLADVSFLGCGGPVKAPVRTREAKPKYTPEAMRRKIEGTVELQGIVDTDGRIREIRVTRSLDQRFGLDDQARKAVEETRFKPATRDGVPVRVLVTIELRFTLR